MSVLPSEEEGSSAVACVGAPAALCPACDFRGSMRCAMAICTRANQALPACSQGGGRRMVSRLCVCDAGLQHSRPPILPALYALSRPAVVDVAEPDYLAYLASPPGGQLAPNDPRYPPGDISQGQWHLPQIWAPAAWNITTGSTGVRVGAGPSRGRGPARSQRRCTLCPCPARCAPPAPAAAACPESPASCRPLAPHAAACAHRQRAVALLAVLFRRSGCV